MVHGHWKYFYRAIDRDGALVDVMLSEHRNLAAAKRFFRLDGHRRNPRPGHDGRPRRLHTGDLDGTRQPRADRTNCYLDNRLEQNLKG